MKTIETGSMKTNIGLEKTNQMNNPPQVSQAKKKTNEQRREIMPTATSRQ
jgi:hypothetical protein